MEIETRLLFKAVEVLLSNCGSVNSSTTGGGGLEQSLERNLVSFRALLEVPESSELNHRLHSFKSGPQSHFLTQKLHNPTLTVYADFALEALALIAIIDEHTSSLNEADERTAPQTRSGVPVAPSALLSVKEQKALHSLLEFVIALGIYPHLLTGVGRLASRHAASISKATDLPQDVTNGFLYAACSVLVKCFRNKVIGASLLTRHLSDVLVALIQVCYSPNVEIPDTHGASWSSGTSTQSEGPSVSSPADILPPVAPSCVCSIKESCMKTLQNLLTKTYQPLIIRELWKLLILQQQPLSEEQRLGAKTAGGGRSDVGGRRFMETSGGGKPEGTCAGRQRSSKGSMKWLQKACGQLLSERLLSKNGVEHVISGIMDLTTGTTGIRTVPGYH